jgi:hypothetical protein
MARMTIKELPPRKKGILPNNAAKVKAHRILHLSHKMFHTIQGFENGQERKLGKA